MQVSLGVSNRHVHLNDEDFNILFGNTKIEKIKDLIQTNQYASNLYVDIITPKNQIRNVRVVGPIRNYTQVEISKTDAYYLGINPPVRDSGDLTEASVVTLKGPTGTITKPIAIIATRHIHVSPDEIKKRHLEDVREVSVTFTSEKSITFNNVKLKIEDQAVWELHLDTDDANGSLLKTGDIGIVNIPK